MATRLGASLEEMYHLAETGEPLSISAICTVFAESEVIRTKINEREDKEQ